jgi:hypothetical protein
MFSRCWALLSNTTVGAVVELVSRACATAVFLKYVKASFVPTIRKSATYCGEHREATGKPKEQWALAYSLRHRKATPDIHQLTVQHVSSFLGNFAYYSRPTAMARMATSTSSDTLKPLCDSKGLVHPSSTVNQVPHQATSAPAGAGQVQLGPAAFQFKIAFTAADASELLQSVTDAVATSLHKGSLMRHSV